MAAHIETRYERPRLLVSNRDLYLKLGIVGFSSADVTSLKLSYA